MRFKITKVYSDPAGDSRFMDIEIPLADAGNIGFMSESILAQEVIFREVAATYNWDFHTAPQRQFVILLDGAIEIETSLGDKRQFGTGEILLLEDTEGKGHKTRNLQAAKRKSVFITLP